MLSLSTYDSQEDHLLSYVSKSKKLPEIRDFIEKTPEGGNLLDALHSALTDKTPQADIFSHEYALMLTQILFEKGRISENERMTVFLYLTILRTHTEKQALRPKDNDCKVLCDVEVILPGHPKYKEFMRRYLGQIFMNLMMEDGNNGYKIPNSKKYIFSIDKVLEKIENSFGFEDAIFTIGSPHDQLEASKVVYTSQLEFAKTNFLFAFQYFSHENLIILPSTTIFRNILEQLNPEINFALSPCLGSMKPETLFRDFHSVKRHAMSIYSEHIISNPDKVHTVKVGPLGNLTHDMFHVIMFCLMFDEKMYQFYTRELVPFLINLSQEFKKHSGFDENQKEIMDFLNETTEAMNDYLLPEPQYYDSILPFIYNSLNNISESNQYKSVLQTILCLAFNNLSEDFLSEYKLNSFENIGMTRETDVALNNLKNQHFPNQLSDWTSKCFESVFKAFPHFQERMLEDASCGFTRLIDLTKRKREPIRQGDGNSESPKRAFKNN